MCSGVRRTTCSKSHDALGMIASKYVALSPLFVKVWRMYTLLHASKHFRRVNVTNFQAVLYTLPLIGAETVILTIFSFVDPPRVVEDLGGDTLEFGELQTLTCQQKTRAFAFTQGIFHAFLVLIGCFLAYQTRNLDPKFGEAKQLAFAMYNVFFTGVIVILFARFIEMEHATELLLQAIAVAWATMLNSAAFVVPRLVEVRQHMLKRSKTIHSNLKFVQRGDQEVLVDVTRRTGEFSSHFGLRSSKPSDEIGDIDCDDFGDINSDVIGDSGRGQDRSNADDNQMSETDKAALGNGPSVRFHSNPDDD